MRELTIQEKGAAVSPPPLKIAVEGLGATVGTSDGAARVLLGLLRALGRRDDVVVTAFVGPSMRAAAEAVRGLDRVVALPTPDRLRRLFSQHFVVPALARRERADAVIYSGNYAPLLAGPASVVVVQNLLLAVERLEYGRTRALYRRWARSQIARRASVVVPISHTLAHELERAAPRLESHLRVVHPGVDVEVFGTPSSPPADAPSDYFLGVGTAWRYRDYPLALEAVAVSGLPHAFVVVGDAPRDERARLERHARRLGLTGRLRFAGRVSETDELKAWYAGASALVCTSETEAFALAAVEAMAAGTPVVAVRRTVYPEVLASGGLLVDPTPRDLAAGFRLVLDPRERERLVQGGKRRAAELTWDRYAEEIVAICRSVARA